MARKYSQKVIDEVEEARRDVAEGRVYTEEEVLKMFTEETQNRCQQPPDVVELSTHDD